MICSAKTSSSDNHMKKFASKISTALVFFSALALAVGSW